jgi:hypothetical protein
MGRLKEKLLNNLNENYMDDMFDLSAFEYVELVERYKDKKEDEYVPTDEEMQKLEQMVQDYYNSKEFREYVENYTPTNEYVDSLTDEEIDAAIAEHNANEDADWSDELEQQYWKEQPPYPFATDEELEAINQSITLKYTDNDILDVLDGMVDPQQMDIILGRLNNVWNTKNGVI